MSQDEISEAEKAEEAELQAWFEKAVKSPSFGGSIGNRDELAADYAQLCTNNLSTLALARESVHRALQVCEMFDQEPALLAANQSIAPKSATQMRPDLILCTEAANYILVELKVSVNTERQCVQELLAYSAAAKLQAPFVNEFVYVAVAKNWNTLLRSSVQALMLDGKYVLPLQWQRDEVSGFRLSIVLNLFKFDFFQDYPPLYALVPQTIGISMPSDDLGLKIDRYFTELAHSLGWKCARMQQTGFAVVWKKESPHYSDSIWCLTMATVNQHWENSYYGPEVLSAAQAIPDGRFHKVHNERYNETYDATLARFTDLPEDELFWGQTAAHESASKFFPQSSLSADLLDKAHKKGKEWSEYASKRAGDFEFGGFTDLAQFLLYLERSFHPNNVSIKHVVVFGELRDYLRQRQNPPLAPLSSFIEFMRDFHAHKVRQATERKRAPHEGL